VCRIKKLQRINETEQIFIGPTTPSGMAIRAIAYITCVHKMPVETDICYRKQAEALLCIAKNGAKQQGFSLFPMPDWDFNPSSQKYAIALIWQCMLGD